MAEYALKSHIRAKEASENDVFLPEIIPTEIKDAEGRGTGEIHAKDEGVRLDATLERIASLAPIIENGILTPGTASQICDGSSGVMVCNDRGLKKLGVEPLARIRHMSVIGHDPVIMLEAPIPATKQALERAKIALN